jgi:DNA-binding response OmpR family regulator
MPKKILVADDDPGIGDMLQLMLEEAGYDVEIQGDGRTICRYLKSQEATHALPIILLSAHNGMRQMTRDAGADDFLAKPFEMGALLALIAKYLGSE